MVDLLIPRSIHAHEHGMLTAGNFALVIISCSFADVHFTVMHRADTGDVGQHIFSPIG
jgi:hypothetical protein